MDKIRKTLVLKTSITTRLDLIRAGRWIFPDPRILDWHIDLEDCDKVLRVECYELDETGIVEILARAGFEAEKL